MSTQSKHRPAFWLAVASLWLLTGTTTATCNGLDGFININNDAPVAQNSNITVTVDVPFLAFMQATDTENDALTYSIVTFPTRGTVELTNSTTGEYRYTGTSVGTDQFTFRARDSRRDSNTATVTIAINSATP